MSENDEKRIIQIDFSVLRKVRVFKGDLVFELIKQSKSSFDIQKDQICYYQTGLIIYNIKDEDIETKNIHLEWNDGLFSDLKEENIVLHTDWNSGYIRNYDKIILWDKEGKEYLFIPEFGFDESYDIETKIKRSFKDRLIPQPISPKEYELWANSKDVVRSRKHFILDKKSGKLEEVKDQ